jgi:hypothetical protein
MRYPTSKLLTVALGLKPSEESLALFVSFHFQGFTYVSDI